MADDVAALMEHLGISQADVVGYSMGGSIALQVAMRHPDLVRKLVVASGQYRLDGLYPEVIAGIATNSTPELMMGTPWYENYASVAPNPDDFPTLVEKLKRLDAEEFAWDEAEIEAIAAPALLIYGDADVIRPSTWSNCSACLGGGVPGDLTGLPKARLAILPGTTHVGVDDRADWPPPMITEFLGHDAGGGWTRDTEMPRCVATDRQPRHDKGGRDAIHARSASSLDGFVAMRRWSPGLGCHARRRTGIARERCEFSAQCAAVVIGRTSFDQGFEVGHWLPDRPCAGKQVYVLTSRPLPAKATEMGIVASRGGPAGLVEQLRGAGLARRRPGARRSAHDPGLPGGRWLDRLGMVVLPVLLGKGIPLFRSRSRPFHARPGRRRSPCPTRRPRTAAAGWRIRRSSPTARSARLPAGVVKADGLPGARDAPRHVGVRRRRHDADVP